ncbi:hypothetical protein OG909_02185 [Streptomyces sp. NBC_01754]|uniref:hypothetical protein n=1 Tax=Streptomyces sp. NBC_01754 TaxID=2975930 RepID=UPI002DD886BD|nr:hypothetical protein [Streptomyces sp. NBC_01754]WSC91202.1 hypothetical protein OG909_02185 [Streptomyces sp. NBC_01754]
MTGALRGPWGVILVPANLLNAYLAYAALMIQPQGAWDENTLTAIGAATALLVTLSVITALFTLFPVRRRNLSHWWLAPPLLLLLAGAVRLRYIEHTYPLGHGG